MNKLIIAIIFTLLLTLPASAQVFNSTDFVRASQLEVIDKHPRLHAFEHRLKRGTIKVYKEIRAVSDSVLPIAQLVLTGLGIAVLFGVSLL